MNVFGAGLRLDPGSEGGPPDLAAGATAGFGLRLGDEDWRRRADSNRRIEVLQVFRF